jgi:hypothetical protein
MTNVIPCTRPKVTVEPHANGRPGCHSVICRVPRCGWSYGTGELIAQKSDAEDQATRHRRAHRDAVPATEILRFDSGVYQASCSCGWYRESPGVHTRTDNEAALAYHLSGEHGLVVCS